MEQVPVVDFAPFLAGDPEGKQRIADAVGAACEGIGFFYLTNHGIPAETMDGIFAAAKRARKGTSGPAAPARFASQSSSGSSGDRASIGGGGAAPLPRFIHNSWSTKD